MSDGRITKGQQFDPSTGFVAKFTEQMEDATNADALVDAGAASTEVTPVDYNASRVRTYTGPSSSALLAEYLTFHGHSNFQLPDVLQSIRVRYGTTKGGGDSREDGLGTSTGTTGSLSLNLRASAQGSMAVLPELDIRIFRPWTNNVPSTTFFFYIADNSTRGQVLARVATLAGGPVHEWPHFAPRAHHMIVVGQQTSLSAQASVQQSVSFSSDSVTLSHSIGRGKNAEAGVTVRKYEIPPTIHGELAVLNPSFADAIAITAEVHLTRDVVPGNQLTVAAWPDRNVVVGPISGVAAGNVTPTTLKATAGVSGIPLNGFYLLNLDMEAYAWDHSRVRATIIDFSNVTGGSIDQGATGGGADTGGYNPVQGGYTPMA